MPNLIVAPVGHYLDTDHPFPLSDYNWQLLAEGDSWFSLTSEQLDNHSLLPRLQFPSNAAAINCAEPGDIAGRMFTRNPRFKGLLQERWWAGILISASGNDLIDVVGITPVDPATGRLRPLAQRILRTADEVAHSTDAYDYVSVDGFNALAGYLLWWFASLVDWCDGGNSRGRPIFIHTYSAPVPRPAGVALAPQGWLYPALQAYAVPRELHRGVADIVFGKLRAFLLGLDTDAPSPYRLPSFHVFDSAAIHLDPADPDATGPSGDWINEIHLTTAGADKLALPFSLFIDKRFSRYAMPGVT
ncbi:hypothetical protein [Variovorax sp. KK3]|uniref:hypothetical protein n=1 Tax=Variovorax sp. KK3 TaxID=1855728 RepID=UPI00097BE8D2|nr:hypothetical protein [Variovorax sp. KK3]